MKNSLGAIFDKIPCTIILSHISVDLKNNMEKLNHHQQIGVK